MDDKIEKVKIPLSEEAIQRLHKQRRENSLQVDSTRIAYEALKKQIELDTIMRGARQDLINYKENLGRLESNLKVLDKQIREKSITQIVSKNKKEVK